jgi:hypothetical protein
MRARGGYRSPVRSVVVVRPTDRFAITGLAKTILKVAVAQLLVRAVLGILALTACLGLAALLGLLR